MHEWVDHTSELELRVRAPSPEQAVSDATAALGELLGEASGEPVERELEVVAGDPAGLLAAWLEELVFLSEREQLVPAAARDVELDDGRLRARLLALPLTSEELGDGGRTDLVHELSRAVPAGAGKEGGLDLRGASLDDVLAEGSRALVRRGLGMPEDVERTESSGSMAGADPGQVSPRARERGSDQIGTLGSGNHFL